MPDGVDSRTAVAINEPVPTATGDATGSSETPGAGDPLADELVGKSASLDGVSFRWHANGRRCLSRTSTTLTRGDPIVMATCANDARQAFQTAASNISAGQGYCLAANTTGGPLFLDLCNNGNRALALTVGGDGTHSIGLGPQGYVVPLDTDGAVGTPILLLPTVPVTRAQSVWDLVGVGNVGGALIAQASFSPTLCIGKTGNTVALTKCDRSLVEQRWRMDAGLLVNDTGECLTCDATAGACTFSDCQSVAAAEAAEARWKIHLFLVYYSSTGSATILTGDANTQTVALNGNNSSFLWYFGGSSSP